jgi:hypothetical protein
LGNARFGQTVLVHNPVHNFGPKGADSAQLHGRP